MDAKEFENAYAENIILEQAAQVAGEGVLVTEEEVLETYHLLNDLITLDTALIPFEGISAPRRYRSSTHKHFMKPTAQPSNYLQKLVSLCSI